MGDANYPEIDVNENGDIFVVWQHLDGQTYVTEGEWYDGTLGTCSATMTFSSGVYQAGLPQGAMNASGDAVVWSSYDGEDYLVYVAQRGADLAWGTPEAVSVAGQHEKLPSLTHDSDGVLGLSWQRSDGIYSRVQASVWNPTVRTWSIPTTLSDSDGSAFWSSIGTNGEGSFTVLWSRLGNFGYQIETNTATVVP